MESRNQAYIESFCADLNILDYCDPRYAALVYIVESTDTVFDFPSYMTLLKACIYLVGQGNGERQPDKLRVIEYFYNQLYYSFENLCVEKNFDIDWSKYDSNEINFFNKVYNFMKYDGNDVNIFTRFEEKNEDVTLSILPPPPKRQRCN